MIVRTQTIGVLRRMCGTCGSEQDLVVTDRWHEVGPFGLFQGRDGRRRSLSCNGCGLTYHLPAPRRRTLEVLHA